MASVDSSKEVPKKVMAHAISIAFGTLCSRILGLVRDIVMAALFRREITDAWSAAFRLPNLFRRVLGEGALSVSFIPVYVQARFDSPERARNLANGIYTLLLLLLAILTAFGVLATDLVMALLLDPSFGAEKYELTVRMARIMFGFVFFITTYAYFMGILNALGSFAWAALAPTLFNLVMILFAFASSRVFAVPGDGLAWGVLVGGFLQMAVLIPLLQRRGALPRWSLNFRGEDVQRVLVNVVPGILGMGLLHFMTMVNLRFASGLGDGAISYLYWADRLLELPLSLVSVSLGSALLPTLSRLWNENQSAQMSQTTNYYLRLNLFIAVPAGFGLYFLAEPIVRALFFRGQFTLEDVAGTASVVRVYAMLLVAASCLRVLVPAYYAVKDVWYPAMVTLACLGIHAMLASRLADDGLQALMVAALMSGCLAVSLLLAGFQQRVDRFDFLLLLQQLAKFVLCACAMAAVLQIYQPLMDFFGEGTGVQQVVLAITIVAGGLAYGGVAYILAVEELKAFLRR